MPLFRHSKNVLRKRFGKILFIGRILTIELIIPKVTFWLIPRIVIIAIQLVNPRTLITVSGE